VGDFMTVTIDPSTQTISYTDVSNSTSGTVPYTVNANAAIPERSDRKPDCRLRSSELRHDYPGRQDWTWLEHSGTNQAVESGPSLSTFEGHSYNYMQFEHLPEAFRSDRSHRRAGSGTTSSYCPTERSIKITQPFHSNIWIWRRRSSIPRAHFSPFRIRQ